VIALAPPKHTAPATVAERERNKRIDLIRGGQGRTAQSVQRDAAGIVWVLVLGALVIVLLILAS